MLLTCISWAHAQVEREVPERVDDLTRLKVEATAINKFIYKIDGQGAVFLINTSEGSILIDTGIGGQQSAEQKRLVDQLATGPIEKIILTHFHSDHAGGLSEWEAERKAGAEVVTHQRYPYMSRIQGEATPFFNRRYKVLYHDLVDLTPGPIPEHWTLKPDRPVYVGADYHFETGGVRFEVIALDNTGEGEDGLLVWLPDHGVLFTGDLFGPLYPMFPNLYSVRGEKYRDPLDYIAAMDVVLELDPEVLVTSHFKVLTDRSYIRSSVTKMRDAVQYVWDQVIVGMNAGKTVWQLMEEIQLPEKLALSQGHGKVTWSVRGIWELVTGWYHYDTVANLYHVPYDAVYGDVVELAGGADALADRAARYLDRGQPLHALRLLDMAQDDATPQVLRTRLSVLERLLESAREGLNNYSEVGLLQDDINRTQTLLKN